MQMDWLISFLSGENTTKLLNYTGFRQPLDVLRTLVDIGIVSYLVYRLILLVRETRAWQLVKGVMFILIASVVSYILGLQTLQWLFRNAIEIAGFAVVVLFQPELRRGLEQIGRNSLSDIFSNDEANHHDVQKSAIHVVVRSCVELSRTSTGALVLIERNTRLGDVVETGTEMNADLSAELLVNIFTPNTPLHDGAVVISGNKIRAAACFLPLTSNQDLSKELGTRHRAALGISEVSDCLSVVVSEETGKISLAMDGVLTRNLTPDMLHKSLESYLVHEEAPKKAKLPIWKVRSK